MWIASLEMTTRNAKPYVLGKVLKSTIYISSVNFVICVLTLKVKSVKDNGLNIFFFSFDIHNRFFY